jgi:hypothetical protein
MYIVILVLAISSKKPVLLNEMPHVSQGHLSYAGTGGSDIISTATRLENNQLAYAI